MAEKDKLKPTIIATTFTPLGEGSSIVNGLPLPLEEERYRVMRDVARDHDVHVCHMVNGVNVCCVGGNSEVDSVADIIPDARDLTSDEVRLLALGMPLQPETPVSTNGVNQTGEEVFDAKKALEERRAANRSMYNGVNQRRHHLNGGGSNGRSMRGH